MRNYTNFSLATYFVAQESGTVRKETLEEQLAFFEKYLKLDHIYLEPYRGCFTDAEQIEMCKRVFEKHGIRVSGGMTTVAATPEGDEPKQRLFGTFCYNDEKMLEILTRVSTFLGEHFDDFIIDDFFFTNCTCDRCRAEKESFNRSHGITDGSWQEYRLHLMKEVSERYVIGPARRANPGVRAIIKYPNWAESYQETGYAPALQREMYDGVYTGTETRDEYIQDQHLPRYLSYSLMTYFENMCPGRNGGGWFDPFDIFITEQYLEQAYLTAFAKGQELMLFCFQALQGSVYVPALGFRLDRLDRAVGLLGKPTGVYCYLPDNSRGEDGLQDHLGMAGLPVVCTPYFPENEKMILLTRAAACDPDIVSRVEQYVAKGGKALATAGFIADTEKRGIHALTSVRMQGRKLLARTYMTENLTRAGSRMSYSQGREEVLFPVPEFANNASWALIKAVRERESTGLLLRDTYGKGAFYTLAAPECFDDISRLPMEVLTRLRAEFPVNGIYAECEGQVSLFMYDNGTFILYPYVGAGAHPMQAVIHAEGRVRALRDLLSGRELTPCGLNEKETLFKVPLQPGQYTVWAPERENAVKVSPQEA